MDQGCTVAGALTMYRLVLFSPRPELVPTLLRLLPVLQLLILLLVSLFHLVSLLLMPLFHLLFSRFVGITLRQLLVVPFLLLLQFLMVLRLLCV